MHASRTRWARGGSRRRPPRFDDFSIIRTDVIKAALRPVRARAFQEELANLVRIDIDT
jgi:hypothetical protein